MNAQTHSAVAKISAALIYLRSQCDGASSRDGTGFNGRDASFGRAMAEKAAAGQLSINMVKSSFKMLKTYRYSQLEPAGYSLPTEAEFEDFLANHSALAQASKAKGTIDVIDNLVTVLFDYDAALVQKARDLKSTHGGPGFGIINGVQKGWQFNLIALDDAIHAFPDFEVTPAAKEAHERVLAAIAEEQDAKEVEAMEREMRVAGLLEAVGDLSAPIGQEGITLYQHQREGVKWLLENERAILADDMGLGKTVQALIAASAYNLPIFVVCPVSLRDNWLREAASVQVPIQVFSWAKLPEPVEHTQFVLIGDECHYCQTWGTYKWVEDEENPDGGEFVLRGTRRTADFCKLARHENCAATFLLTGTPIKNGRPSNLYPLLYAIQHPLAADKKWYDKHFCNAGPTAFSRWDTSGAAHLDELHIATKDRILRRRKSQCLDLPKFTRIFRAAEFSSDARAIWQETFDTMRAEYDRRLEAGEILPDAEALVMLTHLRKAGEIAKVETVVEMAAEMVEQEAQVVLFCCFHETVEALWQQLEEQGIKCSLLTGETPQKERDGQVQAFQRGETKVFICTHGAGGVGITLTAAQYAILVGRPWTPGDAMQAESRIDRIGQQSETMAYWIQDDKIDAKIDQLLVQKAERIELVLQGQRKTFRGVHDINPREVLAILFDGEGERKFTGKKGVKKAKGAA